METSQSTSFGGSCNASAAPAIVKRLLGIGLQADELLCHVGDLDGVVSYVPADTQRGNAERFDNPVETAGFCV